jgi:transposase
MEECSTFVGLDVHKMTITVAVAEGRQEPRVWETIPNTPEAVEQTVGRLRRRWRSVVFAYEAGPCGYGLYRQLALLGARCDVIAPSLIPRRPGDRVKTDRRDAMALARQHRSGDLVRIWVPDEHQEAVRDLVRCREDFVGLQHQIRQRVSSFLLRQGRLYPGKGAWTQGYWRWLRGHRFEQASQQRVFTDYLHAAAESEERLKSLDRALVGSLAGWSGKPLVEGLMSLRGIRLVSAMTLASELGDISRFASARELMSFVGLVPSEQSSGSRRRRGGITKAGNGHVRRVLVESAWAYRHPARRTPAMRRRGESCSEAVRGIAWKAQKRLCGRYASLTRRGKLGTVAVTAVARELVGFVWAIARQVQWEQWQSADASAASSEPQLA